MKVRRSDIFIAVGCILVFTVFFAVLDYELGRPIAQQSNSTGKVISVELRDGTKLKPNDKGFHEALSKATYEWVE